MDDLTGFWSTDHMDYQRRDLILPPLTPELVVSVEAQLGYRLPTLYVELLKIQNGGLPARTCFPTSEATSWAEDHVAITSLFGIGGQHTSGLPEASQFMVSEWGYPPIGVYFADCPSAGHDMVALDYRACGPQSEPSVVHVDQEGDYRITWLAPDFATFVKGLLPEEAFGDDPEETKADDLERIQTGAFSPELEALLAAFPDPTMAARLRALAAVIVHEKGFFALHADPYSTLMYDLQFLLHSHRHAVRDGESYVEGVYPSLVALADSQGFSTGGYAPDFVADWLRDARARGRIASTAEGLQFTPEAARGVLEALTEVWESR
ncbi:SMI1/KNR4 family protein [Deinococcus sp. SDU3-2]|uniref:SMI1/KNR4 family protein n=1 Tax=Deinococcus terrestris TaxID=2651870 RepID=A0A7X1NVA0_9DEIO|nr:SMI1/KNR4 family protein [Deinococcus terrestris]MPY66472.1 SMI1/KNR4 family protein [Deinococcus terrestris]